MKLFVISPLMGLVNYGRDHVLTGLANRRSFIADLGDKVAPSGVLMMIDVDHSKQVNDEYRPNIGDICLRAVAGRIQAEMRVSDTCARIGGEKFAVFTFVASLENMGSAGRRLS